MRSHVREPSSLTPAVPPVPRRAVVVPWRIRFLVSKESPRVWRMRSLASAERGAGCSRPIRPRRIWVDVGVRVQRARRSFLASRDHRRERSRRGEVTWRIEPAVRQTRGAGGLGIRHTVERIRHATRPPRRGSKRLLPSHGRPRRGAGRAQSPGLAALRPCGHGLRMTARTRREREGRATRARDLRESRRAPCAPFLNDFGARRLLSPPRLRASG